MFSALRDRFRRSGQTSSLGLRLVAGYGLLFIGSVAVLAALTYGLLIYFLQQPDRSFVDAQAVRLAEAYRSGGVPAMRAVLDDARDDERTQELLVRLSDREGRTLFLSNPDDWLPEEIEPLAQHPIPNDRAWIPLGAAQDADPLAALALRVSEDRVLQVGIDADLRADVVRSMQSALLAIVLPVVLLAVTGGALLAYRALRPVRRLVRTVHTVIETGDVETRAPVDETAGEFATLTRLFNRMLDRIERLVRGMRDTVDHVAHDLRTPMTRLRARAELALQYEDDPDALRDALADLVEASDVVLEMLDGIMDVAEAEADTLSLDLHVMPVRRLVHDVGDAYAMVAEEKGVAFDVDIPPELTVVADTARMRQVIANLIDNAVKYTPPGGRVEVTASQEPADDGQRPATRITVRDTGIGIAEDEQPRIWDRLYRGDRSRSEKGLGLGLSLVRAIVQGHGGRVTVDSVPGEGSTFQVVLPQAETTEDPAAASQDGRQLTEL